MTETWLNRIYKFKGKIFSLRVGDAKLDDGSIVQREIIEHQGGVAIVPMMDNHSVMMLRQFRISVGKEILELPGGRVELGEAPDVTARRELREEIGYEPEQLLPVANFFPAPGFTNLKIHIYLAFNLHKTKQDLEWDEKPELIYLTIPQIEKKIMNGEFEDGNTIIGLFSLLHHLNNQAGN